VPNVLDVVDAGASIEEGGSVISSDRASNEGVAGPGQVTDRFVSAPRAVNRLLSVAGRLSLS
jgi:hypothetical protein